MNDTHQNSAPPEDPPSSMMARIWRSIRASTQGRNIEAAALDISIWACATFTWGAMTASLANLNEHPSIGSWLVAAAFATVVSVILTITIRRAFTETRPTMKALTLSAWLICALISVIGSYGTWFERFSAERLAAQQADNASRAIIDPLTQFQASYEGLALAAKDVATYSSERAATEESRGGTCGSSGPLQGSRFRLRQLDRATYANFARHFEAQNKKVAEAITTAKRAASTYNSANHREALDAIRGAADTARTAGADPMLGRWNAAVTQRLAQGQGPITDSLTGEVFTCPDATLAATLSAAAEAKLPAIPNRLPEITAPTLSSSTRRGIQIIQGDIAFDPALDTLPVGAGVALDLLIVLLAWLRGTSLREQRGTSLPQGRGSSARLRDAFVLESQLGPIADEIDRILTAPGSRMIELIERHSLEDGQTTYVFQPINPSMRVPRELKRALRILTQSGELKFLFRASVARLPADWQESVAVQLPGTSEVAVYKVKTLALSEIDLDSARHAAGRPDDLPGIFFTSRSHEDA